MIADSSILISEQQKETIRSKIWQNINAKISQQTPVIDIQIRKKNWQRWAIAICLGLLIGGVYWLIKYETKKGILAEVHAPENYESVFNQSTENKIIKLSDGSSILLYPNSVLCYPKFFDRQSSKREVYLSGDAFFKIFHNPAKHFIVHTSNGLVTEVLGTSFNIIQNRQSKISKVEVVTGRVSVYAEKSKQELMSGTQIIITPNQEVAFNSVNKRFFASLVENPKPLKNVDAKTLANQFTFEETPLATVLNNLIEFYGIDIKSDSELLLHCPFTGDISDKKLNLYSKLDIICQVLNASYEIDGTRIIIKGSGCN